MAVHVVAGFDHARQRDGDEQRGGEVREPRPGGDSARRCSAKPRPRAQAAGARAARKRVHANWTRLRNVEPWTNHSPFVLARIQPATSAPLSTTPTSARRREPEMMAATPHATCKNATAAKTLAACGWSACAPMAAAWTAPALTEAAPAIKSGRVRELGGGASRTGPSVTAVKRDLFAVGAPSRIRGPAFLRSSAPSRAVVDQRKNGRHPGQQQRLAASGTDAQPRALSASESTTCAVDSPKLSLSSRTV